jgi:hypothetical protein
MQQQKIINDEPRAAVRSPSLTITFRRRRYRRFGQPIIIHHHSFIHEHDPRNPKNQRTRIGIGIGWDIRFVARNVSKIGMDLHWQC